MNESEEEDYRLKLRQREERDYWEEERALQRRELEWEQFMHTICWNARKKAKSIEQVLKKCEKCNLRLYKLLGGTCWEFNSGKDK